MTNNLDVSFVIPCFNEEEWISTTIFRIREELEKTTLLYEIIVVDNQSHDNSANIATSSGALVYSSSAKTVAAVRNYGFSKSCGKFVVFLDCDVHLSQDWGLVFSEVIKSDSVGQKTVTGSHCSVPTNLKEPLCTWYRGIENDTRNTHLGTGHMIMVSAFFEQMGMFNEDFASGEDYDFCHRVLRAGGEIFNNTKLKVCHMDYPTNIGAFVKREYWHGTSDFKDLKAIVSSKIAVASIIFIILNISVLFLLTVGKFNFSFISIFLLISLLALVVIKKFGYTGIRDLVFRGFIAYFYFLGRSMSIKNLFSR